jgi:putative zinc finger/helix-turn-helix YgiT family protein
MKPYPWKCATCRHQAVEPVTLSSYHTELDHDGRTYEVAVENLDVLRCTNCGAIVLDDDASERLSGSLREAAGLLSPERIRHHREGLGLTQKQLANLLRISESTLSRWETGGQIQQRCMDAFLRVAFQSAEARRILGDTGAGWGGVGDATGMPMAPDRLPSHTG